MECRAPSHALFVQNCMASTETAATAHITLEHARVHGAHTRTTTAHAATHPNSLATLNMGDVQVALVFKVVLNGAHACRVCASDVGLCAVRVDAK